MQRIERKSQPSRIATVKDSQGRQLQVIEVTEFVRVGTLHGTWSDWQPGRATWTLNGQHVNPTDSEDKMQVAATGEVLTVLSWNPPDRPPGA